MFTNKLIFTIYLQLPQTSGVFFKIIHLGNRVSVVAARFPEYPEFFTFVKRPFQNPKKAEKVQKVKNYETIFKKNLKKEEKLELSVNGIIFRRGEAKPILSVLFCSLQTPNIGLHLSNFTFNIWVLSFQEDSSSLPSI